ncbi:MAG: hypothetical protein JNG88_14935 [Phycisphaerales bacterium]|nr:hypothetical protein [Phycisphaerales bacterium]
MRKVLAAAVGILFACPATAQLVEVIYCNVPGQTTQQVPGIDGARFRAGFTNQFERPFRSQDGRRWALTARVADVSSDQDQVLIIGGDVTGMTVVQKGVTEIEPGRVIDLSGIDPRVAISDAGVFVFTANLTGDTADDEVVVVGDLQSRAVILREGQSIDSAIAGARLGPFLDACTIDNETHAVGVRGVQLQGVPIPQSTALLVNNAATAAIQTGVSVPTPGVNPWTTLFAQSLYCDDTCGRWIATGQVVGGASSNDVIAVNGGIVIREGAALAPFTSPVVGIGLMSEMISNGSWFARGSNLDGMDWIVNNGALIATGNSLVPRGFATERYNDTRYSPTWFHMAGNYHGDFVIGGTTDFPDSRRNAVLVWNNEFVVLRKGDPVDLNGNGLADDDTFVELFNDEDGFLTEDGYFYFTCDIRKGPAPVGQIFGRIAVVIPGQRGDMNCDGVVNNFDIDAFIIAVSDEFAYEAQYPDCYRQNGDTNGDGRVDNFDIGSFVECVQNQGCE